MNLGNEHHICRHVSSFSSRLRKANHNDVNRYSKAQVQYLFKELGPKGPSPTLSPMGRYHLILTAMFD